jgi:hypothetical protein
MARIALTDQIKEICKRIDLEPSDVDEIVITPTAMEVGVQLRNAKGHKYVIHANGDPDSPHSGSRDPNCTEPECGKLARKKLKFEIIS